MCGAVLLDVEYPTVCFSILTRDDHLLVATAFIHPNLDPSWRLCRAEGGSAIDCSSRSTLLEYTKGRGGRWLGSAPDVIGDDGAHRRPVNVLTAAPMALG